VCSSCSLVDKLVPVPYHIGSEYDPFGFLVALVRCLESMFVLSCIHFYPGALHLVIVCFSFIATVRSRLLQFRS
jgi:hypothetical protein